jgi:hypothetical protein
MQHFQETDQRKSAPTTFLKTASQIIAKAKAGTTSTVSSKRESGRRYF